MRSTSLALLLASICVPAARATYSLQTDYSGANFFEEFDFFTEADPTGGTVRFVNEAEANDTALAGYLDMGNGQTAIYMAADSTSEVTDGSGRSSVRVSSNQTFNHGLFIIDIQHMPTGCGTWPAFWLLGPSWPQGGEIDIVEGVNLNTQNAMTLHTSPGFGIDATNEVNGYLTQGTDCNAQNAT
jgi:beta-glucanase (GH16 family)